MIKFGRGRAEGLSLFIFLFVTAWRNCPYSWPSPKVIITFGRVFCVCFIRVLITIFSWNENIFLHFLVYTSSIQWTTVKIRQTIFDNLCHSIFQKIYFLSITTRGGGLCHMKNKNKQNNIFTCAILSFSINNQFMKKQTKSKPIPFLM